MAQGSHSISRVIITVASDIYVHPQLALQVYELRMKLPLLSHLLAVRKFVNAWAHGDPVTALSGGGMQGTINGKWLIKQIHFFLYSKHNTRKQSTEARSSEVTRSHKSPPGGISNGSESCQWGMVNICKNADQALQKHFRAPWFEKRAIRYLHLFVWRIAIGRFFA